MTASSVTGTAAGDGPLATAGAAGAAAGEGAAAAPPTLTPAPDSAVAGSEVTGPRLDWTSEPMPVALATLLDAESAACRCELAVACGAEKADDTLWAKRATRAAAAASSSSASLVSSAAVSAHAALTKTSSETLISPRSKPREASARRTPNALVTAPRSVN